MEEVDETEAIPQVNFPFAFDFSLISTVRAYLFATVSSIYVIDTVIILIPTLFDLISYAFG